MEIAKQDLKKIIADAVTAGIAEYKRKELEEKLQQGRYKDTLRLMKSYRAAQFSTSVHEQGEGANTLHDATLKANRLRTEIAVEHINKALEEIKQRRENDGRLCEYEAFRLYFIEGRTYQTIAERLNTGERTPRRWVTGILQELSVMLWGIDDSIL